MTFDAFSSGSTVTRMISGSRPAVFDGAYADAVGAGGSQPGSRSSSGRRWRMADSLKGGFHVGFEMTVDELKRGVVERVGRAVEDDAPVGEAHDALRERAGVLELVQA